MKNKNVIISAVFIVLVLLIAVVAVNLCTGRNKNIEITVKTNDGIPFKWECEIENESIVQCVKEYEVERNKDNMITGGPKYINYVFKGVKKGDTKVRLKYVNTVDGSIAKVNVYNLKVDLKHNVTLVSEEKE